MQQQGSLILQKNIIPVRGENIPGELKALPQWVVWRGELRDGRVAKIPYRADGTGRASSTDRNTWSSFISVIGAYRAGGFDGIGFVFARDGGLVGIDLDHCITDGVVELDAQTLIDDLNSYAEVSVSGSGIHVIVKGSLPGDKGHRRGGVEMYSRGRYFTVTGAVWGNLKPISDAQLAIDRLCECLKGNHSETSQVVRSYKQVCPDDRQLLQRAAMAKNGYKFSRLWAGDTSDYGGDDSRADLALMSMLIFWTSGDALRADRLFRQSGLMREKWERDDYRRRTFERLSVGGA
jgi:putative DNA primase/helicase